MRLQRGIYFESSLTSCCRSRCDKDCFHHLTIALHLSLCCESEVHQSVFMSLSFSFLFMVSLNCKRGRPLCIGSLSGDILMRCPVQRRFFLIRSSIDGSPVRSSISLLVTLSIQVILMIERRCRIMKACSFSPVVYTLSRPRLPIGGWTARFTVNLAFNPHGHVVVVPEYLV